jgi:uncharacterized protein
MNLLFNCVFSLVLLMVAVPAAATSYVIGTGNQSGTYYPLGGMLAQVWQDNIKDFTMRAEVTAASVENIIKVSNGQQLVGISMGDVALQAVQGRPPFTHAMDIAVLLALYPNVVQIMVPARSSIRTIQDLKGKRVSLGEPGSGTRISALHILEALGIKREDLQAQALDYSETADAIANSQIDAGVIVGSVNVGAITALAITHDIRILSFSDEDIAKIHAADPSYEKTEVPAEVYHHVPAFQAPAVWNVLVVKRDLDTALAYEMVKSAYHNLAAISNVIEVAKFMTPENAHRLVGVPLHIGTEKFLQETNPQ